MNHDADIERLLKIYKVVSTELRHTATVIWQFSIAIITLQGGALALAAKSGYQTAVGCFIATTGFFLSACFSVMLLRQAYERRGFVHRIHAVEPELRKVYPQFFASIDSPCFLRWFTSVLLAWILLVESVIGFALFALLSCRALVCFFLACCR